MSEFDPALILVEGVDIRFGVKAMITVDFVFSTLSKISAGFNSQMLVISKEQAATIYVTFVP